jgi:hypothetical protein
MSQHILRKPAADPGVLESEIRCRLQRGKTRLLITHILYFLLTVSVLFFVL